MTVTIYLIFLQLNVFTQTDNMAKRKGQAMLDRVSKMARALGEEKGDVFVHNTPHNREVSRHQTEKSAKIGKTKPFLA